MNDLLDDRSDAPGAHPLRSTALGSTVVCPSCSMHASSNDRRLLQPVGEENTTRRCRNCQAVIDLSASEPRIASSLS